ncbi:hypothetical protein OV079_27410 [Nannocystis pusilla]|uniref:Uncharacterized protein n=1 Tax=Nannocystis pusilla TaxID=889268 RepID=A0A9X3F0N9_9BACT|nr:hypothetical protein [Nannocystis pusilla]MCY1009228.1 hypothetical protein [Nannocystis pusilla]
MSNAAAISTRSACFSPSSQSRTPIPDDTGSAWCWRACSIAALRLTPRLMPHAWVGPPTTTRSTPSGRRPAFPTSLTSTSNSARRPSPIASAICRVLPKKDS